MAATFMDWQDPRPLVLIIDADETTRDLYGHWFTARNFQVMCAIGREGLRIALRRERPRLIVTELQARDLTIADLFARLACDDTTRCIPVIVLTTCTDPDVLASAKQLGAAAVLPKLSDFDQLCVWITAVCGEDVGHP